MAGPHGHRPSRLPRALSPLRHRDFRLLFIGQVTSNVGDACYAVALPWYVLASHGGAVLLGTVLAAYGIPRTALIAFGGYASDRWRPQTVMLLTDITRAIVIGALALAAALGPARAGVLVPLAVVIGAGEGLFLPASFSIVPSLLTGDDLGPGNALSSSGTQLATLIGPAVGGALVAIAGPSFAFALDAATFAVSALTLYAMRAPHAATVAAATRALHAKRVERPSLVFLRARRAHPAGRFVPRRPSASGWRLFWARSPGFRPPWSGWASPTVSPTS